MRPVWKGSISFGLVSVPIALYSATQREELKFRLLRAKDLSPVNYKRVAEADGKEVPWDQIVKGYEKADVTKGEMDMAKTLIERMTDKWQPNKYKDEYKSALLDLIEKKVESGDREVKAPKVKARASGNVIDLVDVLRESLSAANKPRSAKNRPPSKAKRRAVA